MKRFLKRAKTDDRGAAAIEYAILCFIGVLIIAGIGQIATSLEEDHFDPIAERLGTASEGL